MVFWPTRVLPLDHLCVANLHSNNANQAMEWVYIDSDASQSARRSILPDSVTDLKRKIKMHSVAVANGADSKPTDEETGFDFESAEQVAA